MTISRRQAVLVTAGALLQASAAFGAGRPAPRELDARNRKRVADLLARMTLAEKIGQMVQVPGGRQVALNSRLTPEVLDRVRAGSIGSFLHVAGAEPTRALQRVAVSESRLGIPLLFAIDVIHGMRTIFPVPIAMAASFDPAVHEAAARVAATETAISGLHWTFAPMADVARDPRWGRIVEGAGEDPWLTARMTEAQVRGFEQGPDRILACVKHFGAYGFANGGRDYDSADISERTLHEVALPSYHAGVAAGTGTMMTAFNDIAGTPTTANVDLVRTTLRERWGYQGLVVSDWNAVAELMQHGVAADPVEAAALALRASIDMDMAGGIYSGSLGQAAARDPELLPLIDEAVTRILATKARLGLFDDPFRYGDVARERRELNSPAHRRIARTAAERSLVLLRNERAALPLPRGARVALIGALADDSRSFIGSWKATGRAEDAVTLRAALERDPHVALRYARGADARTPDRAGIAEAVAAAQASDIVLLAIGEDYDHSAEARSRADIGLPGIQPALVDAIAATGKPIVALLFGGRPLALGDLPERTVAILHCWLPGVEGGPAIADVLTGRVSPAGRLPAEMPRASGQLPHFAAQLPSGRPADPDLAKDSVRYHDLPIGPLFAFGHGLSYARFRYGSLTLDRDAIGPSDTLTAAIGVTNESDFAADEVVQLYIRDPLARVARPLRELRGICRLRIAPGATRTVRFTIGGAHCAYWDAGRWRIEAGRIDLMAGASAADIRARASFTITAPGWGPRAPAAIASPVSIA